MGIVLYRNKCCGKPCATLSQSENSPPAVVAEGVYAGEFDFRYDGPKQCKQSTEKILLY